MRPARHRHLAPLTIAVVLLAGCAGGSGDGGDASAGSTPSATATPSPSTSATPTTTPTPTPTPGGSEASEEAAFDITAQPDVDLPEGIDPHRIAIPAIGVDAPIVDLALSATEVEVPEDFDDAGWWTPTRRPGEIGPSVIGGHVDSTTGPAVFFELDQLQPGDEIVVSDEAGTEVTFVVDRGIQIDKYDRPPEVFGFGEGRPELRLITCGGEFDPAEGHYTDNYVIFAHQADWQA